MSNPSNKDEIMKSGSRPMSQGLHPDAVALPSAPKFRSVKVTRRAQSVGGPLLVEPPSGLILKSFVPPQRGLKRFHKEQSSIPKDEDLPLIIESSPPTVLWKVSKLKPLPEDYDLARTSRFIRGTDLRVICVRIVERLGNLGISVKYDSDNATASCCTSYYVKFQVCLYQGRGDYSSGIIVEVRRTNGGCIKFTGDCRSILNAAEGDHKCEPDIAPKKAMSEMSCIKDCEDTLRHCIAHASEALDLSERYLQHKCNDVRVLGMESLNSLLNEQCCSRSTMSSAIKAILLGKSNPGIQRALVFHLENYDHDREDYFEGQARLHTLALLVIKNAFNAYISICREGCCRALNENPWLMDTLIPILVNDFKNFKSCPLIALAALRCLNGIIPISNEVKVRALDFGMMEASNEAHRLGKIYCNVLKNEAAAALEMLSCR